MVAKTWEAGVRGRVGAYPIAWSLGAFRTTNEDDIIFISTGGVTSNEGFFDNIGDTRRQGIEVGLNGQHKRVAWQLNYTYLDATFRDSFRVTSPNHPLADAEGEIPVNSGDRIPSLPEHIFKLGADVTVMPKFTVGSDLLYSSDQVFRGDEGNLLDTVDSYTVVNLRARYDVNRHVSLTAKVDNVFDTEYETFGLLGEPDEVLGAAFTDPRFLGPGAERGAWVGIQARF